MDPVRHHVPRAQGSPQRTASCPGAVPPGVPPRGLGGSGGAVSLADLHALERALRRYEDQRDLARILEVLAQPVNEQFVAWDDLKAAFGLNGALSPYEMVLLPTACRTLTTLPAHCRGVVATAVHSLSYDSVPTTAEALGDAPDTFRLRVAGYRVLYAADEDCRTVLVIDIVRDRHAC